MIEINLTYAAFKVVVGEKNLAWQYSTDATRYNIFAVDAAVTYATYIWTSAIDIDGIDMVQEGLNKTDFETNYRAGANLRMSPDTVLESTLRKLYVKDPSAITVLGDILTQLGGQVTTSDPVQFTDIAPGGKKPKKKELLEVSAEALLVDVEVPADKKWYLTSWDGSAQGKGFYQLVDWSDLNAGYTDIDTMEVTTGWTLDEKITSITLSSATVHAGTYSLDVLIKDNKDSAKSRISKTFSLDLSVSEEVSVWINSPASGKLVALKLYSSGKNYTFSGQVLQTGWQQYSFPLAVVTDVVLSAVIKIEFIITANDIKGREAEHYYFDSLQHLTGTERNVLDMFFTDAYRPYQNLFPTALPVQAGHHVRLYVTNLDSAARLYEVGFNGREVSVNV